MIDRVPHCDTCACEPAANRPPSCVCEEASSWGNPQKIPPVCAGFTPMRGGPTYCATCEHDKPCHEDHVLGREK